MDNMSQEQAHLHTAQPRQAVCWTVLLPEVPSGPVSCGCSKKKTQNLVAKNNTGPFPYSTGDQGSKM